MILTLEDFAIIFTLLTPVYALAYNNLAIVSKIETRLKLLETAHERIHHET